MVSHDPFGGSINVGPFAPINYCVFDDIVNDTISTGFLVQAPGVGEHIDIKGQLFRVTRVVWPQFATASNEHYITSVYIYCHKVCSHTDV